MGSFEQRSSDNQPSQIQPEPVQADKKLRSQRDKFKGKLMESV